MGRRANHWSRGGDTQGFRPESWELERPHFLPRGERMLAGGAAASRPEGYNRAVRELIAHYVAYRKLVSPSPSDLLPEERFRLYAVVARFPHNLSGQVPWQQRQAGVYDCRWGLDVVRVIVAGQLPREAHNAP